jgi:hypothetical protein
MRRRALILLTTTVLVLAVANGAATAKTPNGLIYFHVGSAIAFVDPQVTNPPVTYISAGNTFDISRDRTTEVYSMGYFGSGRTGPLYTLPLTNKSCSSRCEGTEVRITNLWNCDLDCESRRMDQPRFSPDGKTIYFRGRMSWVPARTPPGYIRSPPRAGRQPGFLSTGSTVPVHPYLSRVSPCPTTDRSSPWEETIRENLASCSPSR